MKEQYMMVMKTYILPIHKLSIECDEFGHKYRDIGYEVTDKTILKRNLDVIYSI